MSKSKLSVLAVALAEKSGLSVEDAEKFIKQMFGVANDALQQDKLVKVKWLGTFKVQSVKDRESIDVNTGERIVIEGRDKISFTPDNVLKEIVNKPFAQFETVVVNDGVDFSAIDEKFAKMEEAEKNAALPTEKEAEEPAEIATELPVEIVAEQPVELVSETSVVEDEVESSPMQEVHVFGEDNTVASEDAIADEVIVISDEQQRNPVASEDKPMDVQLKDEEPEEESEEEEREAELEEESEEERDTHHLMIPKYIVAIASVVFVALIGGVCWFAFNYGKMAAQRDHLALQLNGYKNKQAAPKLAAPAVEQQDSVQKVLAEKAKQDSIRLAEADKAVKMAEEAEATKKKIAQDEEVAQKVVTDKRADAPVEQKKKTQEKTVAASASTDKYDSDPRVRTGAYRIVGVAQTVTVKPGQSLASISKTYLGAGMECYVEALNGNAEVKAGQKIKIPKLELKKKK